jgi:2-polyprenyl-3-methyl-5-hydroxy-6-metoxy-1,4-benzoquinol methylase
VPIAPEIIERRLRAYYDARADEEPESDPEAALRFKKALRHAVLAPGARLLDVGAKWGGLGVFAREQGLSIDYIGLELSHVNIEKARALGLDVRAADVSRRLPVDDASCDSVVCLELLEHLPSPIELLIEFRRVLKPEGRVVISVPNPYSWVEVLREISRRPDTEGHLIGFTTPIMENVLALAGFRLDGRFGTSFRIPKTMRLISTDSIVARSRIYVAAPAERVRFAGRDVVA